jgi:hypothetical protein
MAIDIISTDRIYKFERVRIIETWLNVKALGEFGWGWMKKSGEIRRSPV